LGSEERQKVSTGVIEVNKGKLLLDPLWLQRCAVPKDWAPKRFHREQYGSVKASCCSTRFGSSGTLVNVRGRAR
jgi:hypothetical protein